MRALTYSHRRLKFLLITLTCLLLPSTAMAASLTTATESSYGITALAVFFVAYALVMMEESLHLRKSIPVLISAALIWVLVPLALQETGHPHVAEVTIQHIIVEYGELLLFLLVAMTFINTLQERRVFDSLRNWLIQRGFSLRTIFWVTGALSFFISPIADNLTTALIMGAVILAVARDEPRFIVVASINIVVAANAGGAFSPFGDITTLMVWQSHYVHFSQFFNLFIPALINWLVPAILMFSAVPKSRPKKNPEEIKIKRGGLGIVLLFLATITSAVAFHLYLNLPPMLGMMTGLGLLKLYGYFIGLAERKDLLNAGLDPRTANIFDSYALMQRAEWDTLMFFYGVILSVGGLAALGYLAWTSHALYTGLGPTWANIGVGLASAIVDNIPVIYAVITMHPAMNSNQWLLVTLTAGVGGSLLSIGSAAGVGLMGQARGIYTFKSHLRWTWAIALGYFAAILTHLWLNASLI